MEKKHILPEEFNIIADYLAGETSYEESQRLEKWMEEKPENKKLFEKVKRVWQASEIPVENFRPDAAKAWEKVKPKDLPDKVVSIHSLDQNSNGNKNNKRWYYAVAASLSLLFILGLAFFFMLDEDAMVKLSMEVEKVKTKEKGKVLLADGSHVWINSNSKLYYPENFDETRVVYLEGEAFFEIQKDEKKPFIIHSGSGIIKVLGTSFNVLQSKKEGLIVNVTEGKVALISEKNQSDSVVLLKGDEGMLLEKEQRVQKSQTADPNFMAWKTGILYFDNVLLSSVAETLSRHYDTNVITTQSAESCKLTSTFDNKSLEEVLEVIELTMNVNIKKEKDKVIIEELGCL